MIPVNVITVVTGEDRSGNSVPFFRPAPKSCSEWTMLRATTTDRPEDCPKHTEAVCSAGQTWYDGKVAAQGLTGGKRGSSAMRECDIAVVGAGSAGLVAALTANRRGAKVAVIEKRKIGGDCTHSGCIPSKTLINSASAYHHMRRTEPLGLPDTHTVGDAEFARVMDHVDSVVQSIYQHEKPKVFQDMGIDVYIEPSGASFLDNRTIRVGDDVISADYTIVCTGSSPKMIDIQGHRRADITTTDNFWRMR